MISEALPYAIDGLFMKGVRFDHVHAVENPTISGDELLVGIWVLEALTDPIADVKKLRVVFRVKFIQRRETPVG